MALVKGKKDKLGYPALDSFYLANAYITIVDGRLIDKTAFGFDKDDNLGVRVFIAKKETDWRNLPNAHLDAIITLKIHVNENGELTDISIIQEMTLGLAEVKLEEIWKKEILRQIKSIPKWTVCKRKGKIIHQERLIYFQFKPSL